MAINNPESKHRTKLNSTQIDILRVLAKFRFGSNNLVAQYYGKKDRSFMVRRLSLLVDRGLIAERFDSSYRIKSKPAAYCLTPVGARELEKYQDSKVNIKATYRDADASEDFIERCLSIFTIHNQLKAKYGDTLKFVAKADLADFDYFPKPLPDGYIRLENEDKKPQYFLDLIQSKDPFFVAVRKVRRYLTYADEATWEGTGTDLPTIILLCDSNALQKRLEKHIIAISDDIDSELRFHVIDDSLDILP